MACDKSTSSTVVSVCGHKENKLYTQLHINRWFRQKQLDKFNSKKMVALVTRYLNANQNHGQTNWTRWSCEKGMTGTWQSHLDYSGDLERKRFREAHVRASKFMRGIQMFLNLPDCYPDFYPVPLWTESSDWLKLQFNDRLVSSMEQNQRKRFGSDFLHHFKPDNYRDILFTGNFVLELGANVAQKKYNSFGQDNNDEGGKRLLVVIALHIDLGVIGPYYYELAKGRDSISANEYLKLLKKKLVPKVRSKLKPEAFNRLTFQQNGHSYQEDPTTLNYLNSIFGSKLISKSAKIGWPMYHKDLNPINYWFERAFMRSLIDRNRSIPETLKGVRRLVDQFAALAQSESIRRTLALRDFLLRVLLLIECQGDQVEHLIQRFKLELGCQLDATDNAINPIELLESLCTVCLDGNCDCSNDKVS